uniref:Ig-like domain-containing protein n=1 Tax=Sinocyclocheilus grahami TaxID=75366 RepID=A0A672QMC7_SINGR
NSKWTHFFSYSHSVFSDGVLITQWPKHISSLPGSSVEMHCYQNDTDYDYKYWYRQIKGELVLVGSYIVASSTNEKGFETNFTVSSTETKKWTLKVDVKEGIDALYLCAARLHNTTVYFNVQVFLSLCPY